MRITNKIIQNNSLANINTNKIYQNQLSNQLETTKKIDRPSDDPVVAIRALRLRSNVTELTQYYERNSQDAGSWLEATDTALSGLTDILTDMKNLCEKGANGTLTTTDRNTITDGLKARMEEVYAAGDADYAGRYLFTGYRTDTSLSFGEAGVRNYRITERTDASHLDRVTLVDTGRLTELSEANYEHLDVTENHIQTTTLHRLRLSYGSCSETPPNLEYMEQEADGTWSRKNMVPAIVNRGDLRGDSVSGAQPLIFVPETGELFMDEATYGKLKQLWDRPETADRNEGELRITYEKREWDKGDLRPEHYFYCQSDPGTDREIIHNEDYLKDRPVGQEISYDVGFNQRIRINTTADECFSPFLGRDVEQMLDAMKTMSDLEKQIQTLKKLEEGAGRDQLDKLEIRLDAANKALTCQREKCQKLFESGMTRMQMYLDEASLAQSQCGNRGTKLELIQARLKEQKATFETLKSENEDVDMTEAAIKFKSAQTTYEAALMAAGKVLKTSLLDYI